MTSDVTKCDEIVIGLVKGVTESAVEEGGEPIPALMYFKDDAQIAVTLHADPIAALKFAAPVCAASWDVDIVYFIAPTLVIAMDTTEMTPADIEKWLEESSLAERWKNGERDGIKQSVTIHRFARGDETQHTVSLMYEPVGGMAIWGEEIITDEKGEGRIPHLADGIYDEKIKAAVEEAIEASTEPGIDDLEKAARRLAYPILALGQNGLLRGGTLMGTDPELRDRAEAVLAEIKEQFETVVEPGEGTAW